MVRNAEEDLKLEPKVLGDSKRNGGKGAWIVQFWTCLSLGDCFIAVFILCGILLYGEQIKILLMWKFLISTSIM